MKDASNIVQSRGKKGLLKHEGNNKQSLLSPSFFYCSNVLLFFICLLYGCKSKYFAWDQSSLDLKIPILLEKQVGQDSLILEFNEVIESSEFLQIVPEIQESRVEVEKSSVKIKFDEDFQIGMPYLLRVMVQDASGNGLNLITRFYGPNPSPTQLLFNELNPEGAKSSNSPEVIEFYVQSDGNTAGILLTIGTKQENKGYFIFPSLEVRQGEYVLLHTRWDQNHKKDIVQCNEKESKSQAKARLSSDFAWDLWTGKTISGLSNTSGVLALYQSTAGIHVLDAVIYSTSISKKRYRGWKTSYLERQVDRIAQSRSWKGKTKLLFPEDAIQSKNSSSTRSLARKHKNGIPIDTDMASDWVIEKTNGLSFGGINHLEVYSH